MDPRALFNAVERLAREGKVEEAMSVREVAILPGVLDALYERAEKLGCKGGLTAAMDAADEAIDRSQSVR